MVPESSVPSEPKKEKFAGLTAFDFRLTEEKRGTIHKVAGPAKASEFVWTLAVSAGRNNEAEVKAFMKAAHATEWSRHRPQPQAVVHLAPGGLRYSSSALLPWCLTG